MVNSIYIANYVEPKRKDVQIAEERERRKQYEKRIQK